MTPWPGSSGVAWAPEIAAVIAPERLVERVVQRLREVGEPVVVAGEHRPTTCSWRPRMRRAARKRRATQRPSSATAAAKIAIVTLLRPPSVLLSRRSVDTTDGPDQRRKQLRRAGWLTVLGVAAETYVASRTRNRPRRAHEPRLSVAALHRSTSTCAVAPEEVARPAEPAALESEPEEAPEREAPTGAVTMVPVTMEAGALSPLHGPGHGPGSNGSAIAVAEPEAPSERVARPIELRGAEAARVDAGRPRGGRRCRGGRARNACLPPR